MSSYLLGVSPSPNVTSEGRLTYSEGEIDSSVFNVTLYTTVNASNEEIIETFIAQSRRNGMTLLIMYIVLYVIGIFGNCTVLYHIRKQQSRSNVNFYIIQLAIADLIVINCTILTEIGWRITVQWVTSEVGCKFVQALRIFGLYLTSNIVICITLDRFFAFVFPLSVFKSHERNKHLLNASYILAFLTSIPNAFVFHLEEHPNMKGFYQCMTAGYFNHRWKEIFYNSFTLVMMYFLPLTFIIVCYSIILKNIAQTTGNCVANDVTAQGDGCSTTDTSPLKQQQPAIDVEYSRHRAGSRKLIERLTSCCVSLFREKRSLSRQFRETGSNVDPTSSSDRSMRHEKPETGASHSSAIISNGVVSSSPEERDGKNFNSIEPEASQSNKYSDTSCTAVRMSINSPHISRVTSIHDTIHSPDKSFDASVNFTPDERDTSANVLLPPPLSKINGDTNGSLEKRNKPSRDNNLTSTDNSRRVNHVKNVLVNLTRSKRINRDNSSLTDAIEVVCTEIESTSKKKNKFTGKMGKRSDSTKITLANGGVECSKNELTEFSAHGTPLLPSKSNNGAGKSVKFSSEASSERGFKVSSATKRNRSASTIAQFSSSVHSSRRTVLMARAKKRTLIMSILIVVTFCICWTPYSFMLAVEVCNITSISIPIDIKGLLYWFAICNSVLNPFVHSYHIFVNVFCRQLQRREERTTVCETSTSQRGACSPGINSKKFKFDQSLYKDKSRA